MLLREKKGATQNLVAIGRFGPIDRLTANAPSH